MSRVSFNVIPNRMYTCLIKFLSRELVALVGEIAVYRDRTSLTAQELDHTLANLDNGGSTCYFATALTVMVTTRYIWEMPVNV